MSRLFRSHNTVSCFFCLSPIDPPPHNPRSFQCPCCECWNRYDAKGEIVSRDPAMYDESLNAQSFAKRAKATKDRLPETYESSRFCHTCQTNQMLLTNLLSNYLPPPNDPEYQHRCEMYPQYKQSIETRYPPVCADCAPAVEEEIRKRDSMARTQALGGFLRASKDTYHQATLRKHEKQRLEHRITFWRLRGVLWTGCLIFTFITYLTIACGYTVSWIPDSLKPIGPIIALLSILWTAWDPKYASLKRAKYQGRALRQRGKHEYNQLQIMAWTSRCINTIIVAIIWWRPAGYLAVFTGDSRGLHARIYCTVCLLIELIILIRSFTTLRLEPPPLVCLTYEPPSSKRLLHPTSPSSSRDISPMFEPDLLAPLTLSSKPIIHPPSSGVPPQNPIFGLPSLNTGPQSSTSSPSGPTYSDQSWIDPMDVETDDELQKSKDPDAMDWTPIKPSSSQVSNGHTHQYDDGSWIRPQRFFAPEEPTGLENLFANTVKLADDAPGGGPQPPSGVRKREQSLRSIVPWMLLSAIGTAAIVTALYFVWDRRRERIVT